MLEKMKNAWRIPELRKKIIYTFGMLLIYRLLCVIPVPGINVSAVASAVKDYSILDFMNMMTGGSFPVSYTHLRPTVSCGMLVPFMLT